MFRTLLKNIISNKNIECIIKTRTLFNLKAHNYCTFNGIDKTLLNNYLNKLKLEYEKVDDEKRKNKLLPIIEILNERDKLQEQLLSIQDLSKENDEELKKLAQEECAVYESKLVLKFEQS